MKVLHLIPSLAGGGAERQLVLLAREQIRYGHEVHVGTGSDGIWRAALERAGARLHWIPKRGNHDPLIPIHLARQIRAAEPAVVHTWLRQMDICGGIAAIATGTPWILTERSSESQYPRTWKHSTRRWLARRAAAIVSNSSGGDVYWEKAVGASVRRFVIPNAIDFEALERAPAMLADPKLPGNVPVVLFAGRLDPEKNLNVLIPALERVVASSSAMVVLCGEGPCEATVRIQLRERRLEDRIRLLGFRNDLFSFMKLAQVLVSVSRHEGHPNVLLEAMACGCPLVVSDIPAHREFLDEESALLVSPSDAAGVAAAIQDVLSDAAAARQRSVRARARALSWSVSRLVISYEEVYRAILSPNGASAVTS